MKCNHHHHNIAMFISMKLNKMDHIVINIMNNNFNNYFNTAYSYYLFPYVIFIYYQ